MTTVTEASLEALVNYSTALIEMISIWNLYNLNKLSAEVALEEIGRILRATTVSAGAQAEKMRRDNG